MILKTLRDIEEDISKKQQYTLDSDKYDRSSDVSSERTTPVYVIRVEDLPKTIINSSDLKQEVIKWVKHLKKQDIEDGKRGKDMYSHAYSLGAIAILKQIYNLTEEDLQ